MVTVNCFLSEKEVFIVRKKSHILLARYLADQMPANESLQSHRKAFCLGNILPDIQPSFVTKRHEYFGTFDEVQGKIRRLVQSGAGYNDRVFWRRSGEVMHYIADYFTFPHNRTYPGNLKDHCSYEEVLKLRLREYLKTDKKDRWPFVQCHFGSAEALCDFIKLRHEEYLRRKIDVEEDIRHIVSLNYQVVEGIRQLAEQGKLHQYLSKKRAA